MSLRMRLPAFMKLWIAISSETPAGRDCGRRSLEPTNIAETPHVRFWPTAFLTRWKLAGPLSSQLPTRPTRPYHPKHGNLPLAAYMCAERQEPCPNSQMIKTAHAYIEIGRAHV